MKSRICAAGCIASRPFAAPSTRQLSHGPRRAQHSTSSAGLTFDVGWQRPSTRVRDPASHRHYQPRDQVGAALAGQRLSRPSPGREVSNCSCPLNVPIVHQRAFVTQRHHLHIPQALARVTSLVARALTHACTFARYRRNTRRICAVVAPRRGTFMPTQHDLKMITCTAYTTGHRPRESFTGTPCRCEGAFGSCSFPFPVV